MLSGYHHPLLAAGWVPAVLLARGGLQPAWEKLVKIGKGKTLSRQQCSFRQDPPEPPWRVWWVWLCQDASGWGRSGGRSLLCCLWAGSQHHDLCQFSCAGREGLGGFNLAPFLCSCLHFFTVFSYFLLALYLQTVSLIQHWSNLQFIFKWLKKCSTDIPYSAQLQDIFFISLTDTAVYFMFMPKTIT